MIRPKINTSMSAGASRPTKAISRLAGRMVLDCLTDLLACVCFLLLWGALVAIYAGFLWIALNPLQVGAMVGAPAPSPLRCAGLGLLVAFLANALTGMTDENVRKVMRRLASMFGLDLDLASEEHRCRRRLHSKMWRVLRLK